MKPLNITYIKSFITKFEKDTGAKVTIDALIADKTLAIIIYEKDGVLIKLSIRPSMESKYEVCIISKLCNVTVNTDNLNEISQVCDLILQPIIRYGTPMKLKAKIKTSHWGVKLVTVERQDGYRANLYVSNALIVISKLDEVSLDGVYFDYNGKTGKFRTSYDRCVLNYDKIQKEGSWSKYDIGFQRVEQCPNGNDYIHPSSKWQKGKLF